MQRLSALVIATLILSACNPPETSTASQSGVGGIKYFKDTRTGLCFASASTSLTNNAATLTYVPCTPEVERLIK
jgi:hypothetical protein